MFLVPFIVFSSAGTSNKVNSLVPASGVLVVFTGVNGEFKPTKTVRFFALAKLGSSFSPFCKSVFTSLCVMVTFTAK